LLVVARTDAEAATFLDSNADPRDHPFIKGATKEMTESFNEATRGGRGKAWAELAGCMTFPDCIKSILKTEQDTLKSDQWESRYMSCSGLKGMKALAEEILGYCPYFDWEQARTTEGYYQIKGCTEFCIARAKAFAPFADIIWMETGKPVFSQAQYFATEVLKDFPHQMLAYNLSPSFNWDAASMTDDEIESFILFMAKQGFCWQFITLAGFHADALEITRFARDYKNRGMRAYVEMIQRPERADKVSTLTHQKWSGAEYIDSVQAAITVGLSSTAIMGDGVTEKQFI